MYHRRLNANSTVDLAGNVAALLSGTELDSIDINVRNALLAEIGTLPDELASASLDMMVQYDRAIAATSVRNGIKQRLDVILSKVNANLRAGLAPKQQFDLCGFSYPFGPRSRVIPNAPTDLSAAGTSNGENKLRFTGNNQPKSVQYEIWRRDGGEGEWMLLAISGKQSFTDSPVLPGRRCEYKVRARSATETSAFSGVASVYGVITEK